MTLATLLDSKSKCAHKQSCFAYAHAPYWHATAAMLLMQDRLQRCAIRCQDQAKESLPPAPGDKDLAKAQVPFVTSFMLSMGIASFCAVVRADPNYHCIKYEPHSHGCQTECHCRTSCPDAWAGVQRNMRQKFRSCIRQ